MDYTFIKGQFTEAQLEEAIIALLEQQGYTYVHGESIHRKYEDILLLDEPTSALDPELVGEVLDTIKKAANEGYTMLLVSHEMSFVRNVATRVIFLDGGKILEDGTPREVFGNPKNERVKEFFTKINRMEEPDYSI